MASPTQGIQLSKVSPSFLHANSTSHTWTFSAIAELIDNAYDPDVNASQLWIDKYNINNKVCLSFVDNGNGMEPHKLLRMLSFGFCEKVSVGGHKPIGQYGNGFKSGSMRLGRDALVFTRTTNSMSVGMLSQNYLEAVKEETVLVPIVTWKLPQKVRSTSQGTLNSLRAILKYSIFRNERSLLDELASLEMLKTGTKIIIYNLKRGNDGKLELDFESDPVDIRNPESHEFDYSSINRPLSQYSPEYRRSLREYGSILFLKPRMKIILRGKKIQTKLISKSLSHTETDIYRPTWLPKPILLTFGFSPNKTDHNTENYGVLMYHRNRLIKAYEKVGLQRQANELGVGVVGVVEVDFLDPIHNKQDFKRTDRYNSFMTSLGTKLNDYWNEKCGTSTSAGKSNSSTTANKPPPFPKVFSGVAPEPDWLWVQCDNCLKWRRLPTGIGFRDLPEKWYCHMNPDASHNRCDVEEEPEDEDEALRRPSYEKTFRKVLDEKKKRKQIEEFQKQQEKDTQLVAMRRELERREEELKKVSAEVSSSTENKPTSTELSRAQKALEESIQKQKAQEKIIRQLQTQKSQIETRQVEIMRAAEGLQLVKRRNEGVIDKSWSPVSSTSPVNKLVPGQSPANTLVPGQSPANTLVPGQSPPNKRAVDGEQSVEEAPGVKRIKTEDGNFITVTLNEDEPSGPDLAARRQKQKENPSNPETIIDLTSDEEDETNTTTNNNNNNNDNTNNNNIPVGGKSTETPIDVEDVPLNGKSNIPSSPLTIISDKENAKVISVDSNEVIAVPEATAKNNLNTNNKAENPAIKDELNKTKIKLEELRENVKRLIEIIVPNIDFGEHKIDDVVVEMIRINSQVNSS